MIIDSHAHYAYPTFEGEFSYLSERNHEYQIDRGTREMLFAEMRANGIVGLIEPSIAFDAIEKQLSVADNQKDMMWTAIGVHPTRCIRTDWKDRKALKAYAERERIIAIGETGLDYHTPRYQKSVREQKRSLQKKWFIYQIKLAHRLQLPLVLHIREADEDTLKILTKYRKKLHGGVVHCFRGNHLLAEKYIKLGFAIGIGGKIFCKEDEAALADTVRNIPLSSMLIETDAPFVLPDLSEDFCSKKKKSKLRNSSLILHSVIRKIAELRGDAEEEVENALFYNTLHVFDLNEKDIL